MVTSVQRLRHSLKAEPCERATWKNGQLTKDVLKGEPRSVKHHSLVAVAEYPAI